MSSQIRLSQGGFLIWTSAAHLILTPDRMECCRNAPQMQQSKGGRVTEKSSAVTSSGCSQSLEVDRSTCLMSASHLLSTSSQMARTENCFTQCRGNLWKCYLHVLKQHLWGSTQLSEEMSLSLEFVLPLTSPLCGPGARKFGQRGLRPGQFIVKWTKQHLEKKMSAGATSENVKYLNMFELL